MDRNSKRLFLKYMYILLSIEAAKLPKNPETFRNLKLQKSYIKLFQRFWNVCNIFYFLKIESKTQLIEFPRNNFETHLWVYSITMTQNCYLLFWNVRTFQVLQ